MTQPMPMPETTLRTKRGGPKPPSRATAPAVAVGACDALVTVRVRQPDDSEETFVTPGKLVPVVVPALTFAFPFAVTTIAWRDNAGEHEQQVLTASLPWLKDTFQPR